MLVTMSDKELNRINVIQAVIDKRMRRRDAAHQLNLTERQVQRLMNRYRESGVSGLASLRRGQPGNHRIPESLKLRILALLREKYSDFGPTLAAEKLSERHDISVSVDTLRNWMTADGLWILWNTLYMQEALSWIRSNGEEIGVEDIARLSPLMHGHINMLGHYTFTLPEDILKGELRELNFNLNNELTS